MQHTGQLLMIEPVNFGFNSETAVNNTFQVNVPGNIQQEALQEFNGLVNLLRANKIDVTVIKDTLQPPTPDSIFPNNWISFHEDGSVFIYPMFAINRRLERKNKILDELRKKIQISVVNDLSHFEQAGLFLEGTGSMVLDRDNKIAYACVSARTNPEVLNEFCRIAGYTSIIFSAKDMNDADIYHTNVMMCIGDQFAVICFESVTERNDKEKIVRSFAKTNKEIIEITFGQLNAFAGNMLQLRNDDAEQLLVMSTQAYHSLTETQIDKLSKYNKIIHAPLYNIESAGGGSARCMIAEIFNKKSRS
jgi:hypothetical protein